jgi:putative cardiolipin synthase
VGAPTGWLERWIAPRVAAHGGRTAFRLLSTGLDAFIARVVLIELAQRSLDLQYYIFHGDTTGSIVVERLIAAADRGVQVRLLLDDWGTIEKCDATVAGLDAHPNIQVRLFNPYRHRSRVGSLGELVTSFTRVNRRMHNKLLVADGQAAVLGGRNIGDEYFGLGELDFQDVDVLAAGPVTRDATHCFEAYWTSEFAVPIAQLGTYRIDAARLAAAHAALRERIRGPATAPYLHALEQSPLAQDLRARTLTLHWARAQMLYDPPGKLSRPAGTESDGDLRRRVAPAAQAVQSELLVVSPYFVPGARGVALLGGKAQQGTSVRVLTNSLAATDVWLVHSGYMKSRRPLLTQGVRLYELRQEVRRSAGTRSLAGSGSSRASLHGKTFVFDRSAVFIGSMNLDPRSLEQNTEGGVLVESAELAGQVASLFERWTAPAAAYEVSLVPRSPGRRLAWTGARDGRAVRLTREPDAGLWRRLGARICSHLPIDWLI